MPVKIAVLKETRPNETRVAMVPSVADKLAKLGLAVDFKPGDEFVAFMNADTRKWRELIPAMGIPQVD